jgi:hypothetical protein
MWAHERGLAADMKGRPYKDTERRQLSATQGQGPGTDTALPALSRNQACEIL